MALVRRGTKAYWYESYRISGRVTSRYVSSGKVAEAYARFVSHLKSQDARQAARYRRKWAALDASHRDLDHRARQWWLRYRETVGAADGLLTAWYDRVEGVFREAMAAAGCHQHKG